jgi:hypothetical protein
MGVIGEPDLDKTLPYEDLTASNAAWAEGQPPRISEHIASTLGVWAKYLGQNPKRATLVRRGALENKRNEYMELAQTLRESGDFDDERSGDITDALQKEVDDAVARMEQPISQSSTFGSGFSSPKVPQTVKPLARGTPPVPKTPTVSPHIFPPAPTTESTGAHTRPRHKRTLKEVQEWRTTHNNSRECSVCGVKRNCGFGHACTDCGLNMCFNPFDFSKNCGVQVGTDEPASVLCSVCTGMDFHDDRRGTEVRWVLNLIY